MDLEGLFDRAWALREHRDKFMRRAVLQLMPRFARHCSTSELAPSVTILAATTSPEMRVTPDAPGCSCGRVAHADVALRRPFGSLANIPLLFFFDLSGLDIFGLRAVIYC